MRGFLEARYARFAFVFDIQASTAGAAAAGAGVDLPAGPAAAGGRGPRSPTKKEQREASRADKQSGGRAGPGWARSLGGSKQTVALHAPG